MGDQAADARRKPAANATVGSGIGGFKKFIKGVMYCRGPLPLEHLFGFVSSKYKKEKLKTFLNGPNNPSELQKFLTLEMQDCMFVDTTTDQEDPMVCLQISRRASPRNSPVLQTPAGQPRGDQRRCNTQAVDKRVKMRCVLPGHEFLIVTTTAMRDMAVAEIWKSFEDNGGEHVIFVDIECICRQRYPNPALLQLCTLNNKCYLFDIYENYKLVEGGLRNLLESPEILKVMHDPRTDAVAFKYEWNIQLCNVFDTQFAHAILMERDCAENTVDNRLSLVALIEFYNTPVKNPFKSDIKNQLKKDRNLWKRRPMRNSMIEYAAADVLAMVPLYHELCGHLKSADLYDYFKDNIKEFVLRPDENETQDVIMQDAEEPDEEMQEASRKEEKESVEVGVQTEIRGEIVACLLFTDLLQPGESQTVCTGEVITREAVFNAYSRN